jgi:hypothetical protein
MKARDLTPGMKLAISGKEFTVEKAKTKGKTTTLKISGPGGTFERAVKAKADYTVVPDKLHDATGAQRRWAGEQDAPPKERVSTTPAAPAKPKTKPDPELDWKDDAGAADSAVREHLGGKLSAIRRTDKAGVSGFICPPPDPTTIAAHLLAWHGVRFDGVSLDEARKAYDETKHTAEEAVRLADWETAKRVHDEQHAAFEAGTLTIDPPHWHEAARPRA